VSEYRLQYLDRSRKFIRQDRVNASSDEEAITRAKDRHLTRRSELWRGGSLVAKIPGYRSQSGNWP